MNLGFDWKNIERRNQVIFTLSNRNGRDAHGKHLWWSYLWTMSGFLRMSIELPTSTTLLIMYTLRSIILSAPLDSCLSSTMHTISPLVVPASRPCMTQKKTHKREDVWGDEAIDTEMNNNQDRRGEKTDGKGRHVSWFRHER